MRVHAYIQHILTCIHYLDYIHIHTRAHHMLTYICDIHNDEHMDAYTHADVYMRVWYVCVLCLCVCTFICIRNCWLVINDEG